MITFIAQDIHCTIFFAIRWRKLREQRDYISQMAIRQREVADDALPLYSLKPLMKSEKSKLVKPCELTKVSYLP